MYAYQANIEIVNALFFWSLVTYMSKFGLTEEQMQTKFRRHLDAIQTLDLNTLINQYNFNEAEKIIEKGIRNR